MDEITEIKRALKVVWLLGDLRYKLHDTQMRIWESLENQTAQEALILSARQLGKSYVACAYAISFCIRNPNSIVRIAAPTLKQAQDIVNDNLEPLIRDAPKSLITRLKSSYRWLIGSSELRLGVLERAHVDSLRGGNAKLIICEEGGFVRSDDYKYAVESVIGPQLLRSSGRLVHVTSPSREPDHYIHSETLPKCQLVNSVHRYSVYDNPQLSDEQINKAIELCGGTDTIAWRREYLAEIVRDDEVVCVPEFDANLHVHEVTYFEFANYLTAIDAGGVRDKTVALLLSYDIRDSKIYVHSERVFSANTSSDLIIESVKNMEAEVSEVQQRFADAPGQLLIDWQTKHTYQTTLPYKDDWEAGLNAVRLLFRQNKIVISNACPFLSTTLHSATFNKNKTDFERTETLGHMDALAALMYGVRMIDKKTNRVPLPEYSKELYLQPKDYYQVRKSGETKVAESIVRRNFMRNK